MNLANIYTLQQPDEPLPLIFDSPHSGTIYPEDFQYSCDFKLLEQAEDKYVDELFASAPNYDATLLCAEFPRTYIDVNRAIDDVDPALLSELWPEEYGSINPSNRSDAGIGLIRRLIVPNMPVYTEKLMPKEIKSRIDTYYAPYHAALKQLIEEYHKKHKQVWHINCHSMPSGLVKNKFSRINPAQGPDFVLGNRDGTTCSIEFTHFIRDILTEFGYKVAINDPYKGVELVKRYSSPAVGIHSIQIEISRKLYMDEETCEKNKGFKGLKQDINALIKKLRTYIKENTP